MEDNKKEKKSLIRKVWDFTWKAAVVVGGAIAVVVVDQKTGGHMAKFGTKIADGAVDMAKKACSKAPEQVAETAKETVCRAAENAGKQFNNYKNH